MVLNRRFVCGMHKRCLVPFLSVCVAARVSMRAASLSLRLVIVPNIRRIVLPRNSPLLLPHLPRCFDRRPPPDCAPFRRTTVRRAPLSIAFALVSPTETYSPTQKKTSNRDVEVFLPSAEASMRFAFSQLSRLPPGGVKWPAQSPSGGSLAKKRYPGGIVGPPGGAAAAVSVTLTRSRCCFVCC